MVVGGEPASGVAGEPVVEDDGCECEQSACDSADEAGEGAGLLPGRALTVLRVTDGIGAEPVGRGGDPVRRAREHGPLNRREHALSDNRKYRKFTTKQKLEIVLASLRGDRSVAELCREHDIAESLLRKWREQALEAAAERFESGQDRSLQAEQRRRIAQLERALGRKTYELELAGEALRGWE